LETTKSLASYNPIAQISVGFSEFISMHNMCNYAAPGQQMDGRQKAQSPHPDPSPKLGAPSKVSSAYRSRMSLLRRHPESDAEAATGAEAIRAICRAFLCMAHRGAVIRDFIQETPFREVCCLCGIVIL